MSTHAADVWYRRVSCTASAGLSTCTAYCQSVNHLLTCTYIIHLYCQSVTGLSTLSVHICGFVSCSSAACYVMSLYLVFSYAMTLLEVVRHVAAVCVPSSNSVTLLVTSTASVSVSYMISIFSTRAGQPSSPILTTSPGLSWTITSLYLALSVGSLLPSSRQHLSCDDCLEVRRENNQNCSVLCCVVYNSCAHWYTRTHVNSSKIWVLV